MDALVLGVTVESALAPDGQQVPGDRQRDILLADARELEAQDELVFGLSHVEDRRPTPHSQMVGRRNRPAQEAVEQAVHLSLNVGHVAERIPSLHRYKRTP